MKFNVKVVTGAKVKKIEVSESVIKIWVNKKPVEGEANEEVIKIIASHYGVPRSSVKILLGHRSKQKVVEIPDDFQ